MSKNIEVQAIPQTIEDFVALRDEIARTPHGGAVMMALALLVYAERPSVGEACLTVAVDRSRLQADAEGYKGWGLRAADLRLIRSQLDGRGYLPRSYVLGTAPEDGYALPAPPYAFAVSANPYSGDPDAGTYKVFVACSGAASPRPVTLKRNDKGLWKAAEWSSLVVGVQPPVQVVEDDL